MAVYKGLEKIISHEWLKMFFNVAIALTLAAAVTIDQQSKNLIKVLVVGGLLAAVIDWRQIKRRLFECDMGAVSVLGLYFLGVLLAIAVNPINEDTLHNLETLSIGFTSVFIWCLMISIRFRADFFWWGILLCAISAGLYALVQVGLHGIDTRAVGSSGKPIMFGDIAMISGLMSIAAMAHFTKYALPLRSIPVIASVMGVTASILSGTRGAWLFLPVAVVLILFFLHRKGLFRLTLKSTAVIFALLCGGLALILTSTDATNRLEIAYENIDAYLTHPSDAAGRTSLGQRFEMWQAALDAFREAPLFGIGPGLFDEHLARLAEENRVNKQVAQVWRTGEEWHPHSHAHSEFFNTLATRGAFGIVTLVVLFAYLLNTFFRLARSDHLDRSSLGLAGVLLVCGYLVFSLSEAVLYHAVTANFFFLCVVSLLYLSRKREDDAAA